MNVFLFKKRYNNRKEEKILVEKERGIHMKNNIKKAIQLLFLAVFFSLLGFGATNVYYHQHYVMIERAEAEDAQSEEALKEEQFITIDKREYGNQ